MGNDIADLMNLPIVVNIFRLGAGRTHNLESGLHPLVRSLRNTSAVSRISLHLKHHQSVVQRVSRNPKGPLHTLSDVDHTLLVDFLFENLSCREGGIHLLLGTLIEIGADRRLIDAELLSDLCRTHPSCLHVLDLFNDQGSAVVLCNRVLRTELGDRRFASVVENIHLSGNLGLAHAFGFHLVVSGDEVACTLERILTGPPRIPAGASRHTIVNQNIHVVENLTGFRVNPHKTVIHNHAVTSSALMSSMS